MKLYLKLLLVSLCFILIVAALSIVYGFIAHSAFTLRYVFNANFAVAAVLIAVGIVLFFIPSSFVDKGSRLLDRSTLVERSFDSRERRQQNAGLILWLGIYNTLLAGLIQILLSVII
jgi:hypothetical protein